MSQFFASGGQSFGTSASVSGLLINIQGWFPLGLIWSACCPRDSQRIFSSTTIQKASIHKSAKSYCLLGKKLVSVTEKNDSQEQNVSQECLDGGEHISSSSKKGSSWNFISVYLFLAVLGLHCFVRIFSSVFKRGLLFAAVCRLLTAVTPLLSRLECSCLEHRL